MAVDDGETLRAVDPGQDLHEWQSTRASLEEEAESSATFARVRELGEDLQAGLLALLLLTDARRPARTDASGGIVPLADQDRGLWLRDRIEEGISLISSVLGRGRVGPYQLQAAIAAVHAEANQIRA